MCAPLHTSRKPVCSPLHTPAFACEKPAETRLARSLL
jgi:hypothetical protein